LSCADAKTVRVRSAKAKVMAERNFCFNDILLPLRFIE
jgi:hypothetical protein